MALAKAILMYGTRAEQPAAGAENDGCFYRVTDEGNILEQSDGSDWLSLAVAPRVFAWTFDGGGVALGTGAQAGHVWRAPCAGTITKVTLLADQAGDLVVDIWKDTLANYPPTDADSITDATPPTLSAAAAAEDETLTDWTVAFNEGDIFLPNIDSAATITRATLLVEYVPG